MLRDYFKRSEPFYSWLRVWHYSNKTEQSIAMTGHAMVITPIIVTGHATVITQIGYYHDITLTISLYDLVTFLPIINYQVLFHKHSLVLDYTHYTHYFICYN